MSLEEYGRILQINTKPETPGERGLPKTSVHKARLNFTGLEGDFNRLRMERKDGILDRAVLIMTVDKILDLRREGWSINFGDLGENFTIHGIEYESLIMGREYRLGKEAIVKITEACNPCDNLAVLPYIGRERKREFKKTIKDRRGWYASVIKEGQIKANDLVRRIW